MLDVGATLTADADTLIAFAHMGSAYARCISNNPTPRVALLSNGEESSKGLPEVIEAHHRLLADPVLNFVGNVEGLDLPKGVADVVVTAGFTGNVVLKMIEGIGETIMDLAQYAYRRRTTWRAGLWMLRGGLGQLKDLTDWHQYGGAPILGFNQPFIKAHGRSNARALENALRVARKAVNLKICNQIHTALAGPTMTLAPHIYRWDMDKTYLRTDFDTLGDLLKTALQRPADKVNVPGSADLIRALRLDAGGNAEVYFVSGSPKQLRGVLTEKLMLDGIHFDGFILKDNLRNLLRGRFRAVKDQIGYSSHCFKPDSALTPRPEKLYSEMMLNGMRLSIRCTQISARHPSMSCYSRRCSILRGVPRHAACCTRCASALSPTDAVERIIIHLDRKSPPVHFDAYGPRVVPVYNYFQAALVLYGDGRLQSRTVAGLSQSLQQFFGFSKDMLRRSFADILRRGVLSFDAAECLSDELKDDPSWNTDRGIYEERPTGPKITDRHSATHKPPDYPSLLRREQQRRRVEKARRRILRWPFRL